MLIFVMCLVWVHNWCVVLVAYVFVHVFAMTGHEPVCAIHCTSVQYVCDVSDAIGCMCYVRAKVCF